MKFEFQKSFEWSNNKKYDFYIPSLNFIIETHGLQHYVQPTGTWGLLSEIQKNDIHKEKIAKKNKIDNYIIIDCRKSEIDYIRNNLLESELSNILNLLHVDWLKCHEFACISLVKVACELWNKYKNARIIANEMKIGKSAIIGYLKQGTKLGWCDYNPKEEVIRAVSKNGKDNGVSIVRLSLEYEYIDEFESMEDVKRKLGIDNVSAVCRGLRNTAGGYRWMYKKDYDVWREKITYGDFAMRG